LASENTKVQGTLMKLDNKEVLARYGIDRKSLSLNALDSNKIDRI